jgi:hypothetical protein
MKTMKLIMVLALAALSWSCGDDAEERKRVAYEEFEARMIQDKAADELDARLEKESAENRQRFTDGLAQQMAEIRGINDAVEREIDLLKERQAAENEIAEARAERMLLEAGLSEDAR